MDLHLTQAVQAAHQLQEVQVPVTIDHPVLHPVQVAQVIRDSKFQS